MRPPSPTFLHTLDLKWVSSERHSPRAKAKAPARAQDGNPAHHAVTGPSWRKRWVHIQQTAIDSDSQVPVYVAHRRGNAFLVGIAFFYVLVMKDARCRHLNKLLLWTHCYRRPGGPAICLFATRSLFVSQPRHAGLIPCVRF